MNRKKHNIGEFNQKWFSEWKDIKAVIPHFEEFGYEEDFERYITRIDIEFVSGDKISLVANALPSEEPSEPNGVIEIFEYESKRINWRHK